MIESVDTSATDRRTDHSRQCYHCVATLPCEISATDHGQSAVITDLRTDSTYYFKLAAHNAAGYGPLSPTVIFHTARRQL